MTAANDAPTAYRNAAARFERIMKVRDALSVLQWDCAAMMPDGGADARAEQVAALTMIAHELLVDPALGDALAGAEAEAAALDPWQRANVAEMRREYLHATAVPADLVEARSRAVSACEMHWRSARAADDFKGLVPDLRRVLDLTRAMAAAKADRFGTGLYDALLDEYEPEGRAGEIEAVFDDLAKFLPGFIDRAIAHQGPPVAPPPGPFPRARQERLAHDLMATLGFDFAHGRLDTSHHPFSGGVPDDVRITTRWNEADFTSGLMAVLHETGHALYEMGLPAAWRYQPVGRARGMSMHESQSLLVEMQASRSREFIRFLAPRAAAAFGGEGPAWDADRLYRHYTHVERGLIRVDADEATYPCHVILRYRLERAMIEGALEIADLQGAWAEGMRSLVGVAPHDDKDGCLQDIHWPGGAWGYFPTYTLGAMTAAQLFAAAVRAEPGIPDGLARGEFAPLLAWLRTHVHGRGSSVSTRQILIDATGGPLDARWFKAHLERRYLA